MTILYLFYSMHHSESSNTGDTVKLQKHLPYISTGVKWTTYLVILPIPLRWPNSNRLNMMSYSRAS